MTSNSTIPSSAAGGGGGTSTEADFARQLVEMNETLLLAADALIGRTVQSRNVGAARCLAAYEQQKMARLTRIMTGPLPVDVEAGLVELRDAADQVRSSLAAGVSEEMERRRATQERVHQKETRLLELARQLHARGELVDFMRRLENEDQRD